MPTTPGATPEPRAPTRTAATVRAAFPTAERAATKALLLGVLALGCIERRAAEVDPYGAHAHRHHGDSAPAGAIRFAAFGDYGGDTDEEADVARLVETWQPDFILTTGDNNYPSGDQSTIDRNIGQYYQAWIHPYHGIYGPGADENRFWPALGNHDWITPNAAPYRAYFELPGNERYYDFAVGPAHFFSIDSDPHDVDGIDRDSVQADWLAAGLAAAPEPFRFVYFHHPPFSSSSEHGSHPVLQWPYRAWGATAVLAGHDHTYEHLVQEGIDYVVTGLGGESRYELGEAVSGSRIGYQEDFGALFVDVDESSARFRFVTRAQEIIDDFTIARPDAPKLQENLVPAGGTWRFRTFGVDPGEGWQAPGYDDSDWSEDVAPIGLGRADVRTELWGRPSQTDGLTARFRRTFAVADPSRIRALDLGLVRDDGAVVYLNGTEVFRTNLPEGEIEATTPALEPVEGYSERAFHAARIPPALLVPGDNVIAVEVHEVVPIDGDVNFDLVLDARVGEPILPAGSTWRYDDSGFLPAGDWTASGFDDAAWAEGPAELGVGEGDEATTIRRLGTAYFRASFDASPKDWDVVVLRVLRDDGAIVYLNGVEVLRSNMPAGDVFAGTLASSDVADGFDDRWQETVLPPGALVDGENTIAVELHAVSRTSPDVSFDLEVAGL